MVTLDGKIKTRKSIKRTVLNGIKSIIKFFSDKNGRFFHLVKIRFSEDVLSQNTSQFIKKYIDTKPLSTVSSGEYEALIVGSDQVWRPAYSNLDEAYLGFAKEWVGIKRIAYAASFGSDEWEYNKEETEQCRKLIKLFDAISVREKTGISLCKEYLKVDAFHVLDPTMLLTKEDYINNLSIKDVTVSKGDLFFYFLDPSEDKYNTLDKIAKITGLSPFTVNSKVEDITATLQERIQPPVEEWIRGFYDAKFVLTDSFHGCVFSMIFDKPFVVIANNKRGRSRFDSLLEIFDQQFRLIEDVKDVKIVPALFNKPNINLENKKSLSLSFLSNALTM